MPALKIAFGKDGDWQQHLPGILDQNLYTANFVDFGSYDLGQADCAVPLNLRDLGDLRRRYGDRNEKYLIPDARTTAICADKRVFNETVAASRYGRMIPPVYTAATRRFPYMLKRRDRLSGGGIFPIRDAADEAAHVAELDDDAYFRQAYAPGREEYCIHMLLVDGRVIYHAANRYEMAAEFAVKGQAARPVRELFNIDLEDGLLDDLMGVMEMLKFNGTCSLDFKVVGGRVWLMEANPRCGFSLFREINWFLYHYIPAARASLAAG